MSMNFTRLGRSDLSVSSIGLGCNAFGARMDQVETTAVVRAALDHGINFFDTADIYGLGTSELLLGRALGKARDQVLVATKFGMDMEGRLGDDLGRRGRPDYMRKAVDASLERLGTDYIDLYQFHTPDPGTPVEETLGAMNELVVAGKVRAIGCSNFRSWELVRLAWLARDNGWTAFVSVQNEYSMYNRSAEAELIPAVQSLEMGFLPYFPLAEGLLTGKYARDQRPGAGTWLAQFSERYDQADWDRLDRLATFAAARGISMLDLAMGGLLAQPAVTSVIAGVSRPSQIASNVAAASWQPTGADLEELASIKAPVEKYAH